MDDLLPPVQTTEAASDRSQWETPWRACQSRLETIERWTLKSPLLASILWMGLLFADVLSIHTPAYETNDDAAMNMIASGTGIGAQPDEHLVYINVVIGLVLKQLYTQMPSIPWYGLSLLAVHFLSHVAVLYGLLKWRYSRSVVFCFLVLFGTIGVQLITRLQFTSTAIWSVECGLFLAMNGLSLRRDFHGRGGWGMLACGAALMIWGSLVRFDSYLAAMLISAIPLSLLVWQLDRSTASESRVWRTALTMIVLVQFPAFGLYAAHQRYYAQDPAWREYLAFNQSLGKINGYGLIHYTEDTKPVFDQIQWSENDYTLTLCWYFDDPLIFGRQNLQALLEGCSASHETVSLLQMTGWWRAMLIHESLWPIWALIPLQLWWSRGRCFAISHFLMLMASLGVILSGLMFLKEPPPRVYYPLFAVLGLYLLSLMRDGNLSTAVSTSPTVTPDGPPPQRRNVMRLQTLSHGFASAVLIAVTIRGLCFSQSMTYQDSQRAVSANRKLHADLTKIGPLESELFVCWSCCFPLEAILPLESADNPRKLYLLSLGWTQQSPVNAAVKGRFGIQDLPLAMLDNPRVYLVASKPVLTFYRTYFREHYHVEVDWEHRFEGGVISIFKPVRRRADQTASNQLRQTRDTKRSGVVARQIRDKSADTDF